MPVVVANVVVEVLFLVLFFRLREPQFLAPWVAGERKFPELFHTLDSTHLSFTLRRSSAGATSE